MTPGDENDLERGGDDMRAAEYVLGVLSAEERAAAAMQIESDPAFARLVEEWEAHLSQLNSGYDEVAPSSAVKSAIDARLFGAVSQHSGASRPGLMQSLAFWRGVAAAAVVALVAIVALPFLQPPQPVAPTERFVASLASDESGIGYLVVYDMAASEISLSHVSGDRDDGRDFELWVIEGDAAPVSLGVIPVGASVHLAVAPAHREMMASGVLFAISDEPQGGSPTGQPTGAVLAAGDLRTI